MSVPPLALLNGEASLDRFVDHSSALRWMASEAGVMTAPPVELTESLTESLTLSADLTEVAIEAPGYAV